MTSAQETGEVTGTSLEQYCKDAKGDRFAAGPRLGGG